MAIELTYEEDLAILTINRPASLNALSFSLIREISVVLDDVAQSNARVLVITGAGEKSFCAGADIKELTGKTAAGHREGVELGQSVFSKLDDLPIPSIALVNGYAFGGGMELALASTFRLALPNAKFSLPEVKLGLIPGYGGTQRLPRLIGQARALEIILSGKIVKAEDALAMGLVNRVVSGMSEAFEFAREFTGFSLLTQQYARQSVMRSGNCSLNEGLRVEAYLSTLAYVSKDAKEGMQAFVESRQAEFTDK
jgi:enoyl-CoA hydratase|tara:strand:- start:22932 stop:23693 length:762 start_codon:yes stop_codon:yes gene_type:complete